MAWVLICSLRSLALQVAQGFGVSWGGAIRVGVGLLYTYLLGFCLKVSIEGMSVREGEGVVGSAIGHFDFS